MEKIDFVLPWANGSNEEWEKIRKEYLLIKKDDKDAHATARYRDMETLRYVLRSIEKHCSWYNKIFLITKGDYPEWLNIDSPKIELIKEDELFIDTSHLPTFSSVAIEMNLSNIDGLSEKFVYLNDDMVIMRSIESSRFFIKDTPVDFLSHGWIPRNRLFELFKKRDTWVHSINNTLGLINKNFSPIALKKQFFYHKSYSSRNKLSNFLLKNIYKKYFWFEHWHHPQPFLKNTLIEVYNEFKDEMMACSKNRFRDNSDLNQYIYRYWQLVKGNFFPYKHDDALISNLKSLKVLEGLIKQIDFKNINFVCFNDSVDLSEEEYNKVKIRLNKFLENRFPEKASFEY